MSFRPIKNFKNEIRSITRKYWIDTHDGELTEKLVRQEIQDRYGSIIATFLIALFIKLAVELIWYWIENNILNPEPVYQLGEPGYND
jgi:hypothetical protein